MKLDARKHPDLQRLRNEGYDVKLVGTHLLVGSVPYVTAAKDVRFDGIWVSPLELAEDCTVPPKDHTAYFVGERPHHSDGTAMTKEDFIVDETTKVLVEGVTVNFQFSYKHREGTELVPYKDYYDKMVHYVNLMLSHARSAHPNDPTIKADVYPEIPSEDGDSPFVYEDTSANRAGIEALSHKLELENLAILGVGGTGSYILDLVAKTRVKNIHLFDDDDFHQHNMYRSPGTIAKSTLKANLKKVDHFRDVYSQMHMRIHAHPYRIDATNLDQLDRMNFVFLCLDSGELKDVIMRRLEDHKISFIDVGMGVQLIGDTLQAMVRVTTSTEGHRAHIRDKDRVSFAPADGDNIYRRNIQVADLNALNAALAVIRWKKLYGYYGDLEKEHHSVYVSTLSTLSAEDA